ncbi:MAG TPA: glycosyltransferase family 2 protein [Opitutaceae bacterium]|nr:glycosyltransferase family 2 protein [Opitutaceae bacterium]
MDSPRPTLICLTPVRNEAWILDRFLQCASTWADHIIIADQQSDDGSREIAGRHPKVRLVENAGAGLDEKSRQELLIAEARKIPGPRILLALDADEMLSANFTASPEWALLLAASPGTSLWFERADLYPFHESIAVYHSPWLFGCVDDGRPHAGRFIHSPRVPVDEHGPKLHFAEIKVLHYQYTDWARMKSKHRLYEIIETLKDPRRSAISIYRQYHHMDPPNPWKMPVPRAWFEGYERQGIDMTSTKIDGRYGYDRQALQEMEKHGPRRFARQAVWEVDWTELARAHGFASPERFSDPRTRFEKWFHRWLADSQPRPFTFKNKVINKLLRWTGW